jgi:hypothetical protein
MVPIVFPAWRTVWMTLDGIPPLLERADRLLRRRARGNHLLPKLDIESAERFGIAIEALRRWTDGQTNRKISDKPPIQYFESLTQSRPAVFKSQCIPTDTALLGVGSYKSFLAERRKAVSNRLNEFLGVSSS